MIVLERNLLVVHKDRGILGRVVSTCSRKIGDRITISNTLTYRVLRIEANQVVVRD